MWFYPNSMNRPTNLSLAPLKIQSFVNVGAQASMWIEQFWLEVLLTIVDDRYGSTWHLYPNIVITTLTRVYTFLTIVWRFMLVLKKTELISRSLIVPQIDITLHFGNRKREGNNMKSDKHHFTQHPYLFLNSF